jgi:hypothetical protein
MAEGEKRSSTDKSKKQPEPRRGDKRPDERPADGKRVVRFG